MAKDENIFKRKDGRREARFVKGYQPSGKKSNTASVMAKAIRKQRKKSRS